MTRDAAIIAARSASSRRDNLPYILVMHSDASWSFRILDGSRDPAWERYDIEQAQARMQDV